MSAFKRSLKQGGPVTAAEEKTDPIPRLLPTQSITLNFTQRSWEECGPGELLYLPLCQNPKYMFDLAMTKQFNKFANTWETMEIHRPHARISNLIMLQDDLRVQSNTPTDATAFTQVVYLLKFCPQGEKQYFKLTHHPNNENMEENTTLTYKIRPKPASGDKLSSQLIRIQGFQNFEQLGVSGAKANTWAGFQPGGSLSYNNSREKILKNAYIPPTVVGQMGFAGANLYPSDNYDDTFIQPGFNLTMAKNQDHISFYKYGDVIDIPIITNLDGLQLANINVNAFLDEYLITTEDSKKNKAVYNTEWCYPGRNRPFLCRSSYYAGNVDPVLHGKELKPLEHCFLAMPPIKKPNGALLGQRCSFLLEQSVSITFNFGQAHFFEGGDETRENAQQVSQDNAVIIRRNIYPTPKVIKPDGSLYCGENGAPKLSTVFRGPKHQKRMRADKKVYPDTFKGILEFLKDYSYTTLNKFCSFERQALITDNEINLFDVIDQKDMLYTLNFDELDTTDKDKTVRSWWAECITNNTSIRFWFKGVPLIHKSGDTSYYQYVFGNGLPLITTAIPAGDPYNVFVFDVNRFIVEVFEKSGMACSPTFNYPAADFDDNAIAFFM